jgi:hypothetical protein
MAGLLKYGDYQSEKGRAVTGKGSDKPENKARKWPRQFRAKPLFRMAVFATAAFHVRNSARFNLSISLSRLHFVASA